MLTQEKLYSLRRLPDEEKLQILLECIGDLCVSDMEDSKNILILSKRRIYQKLNDKNSIKIGRHIFPCINILIKQYQ